MHDPVPETIDDALALWDSDQTVFTVEMGGLGPGYEMAIQSLMFELAREFRKFDPWPDDWEEVNKIADPIVDRCNKEPWGGFSGAQVGAAKNLAAIVCRKGYRVAINDDKVRDRHIQVCRLDLRINKRHVAANA